MEKGDDSAAQQVKCRVRCHHLAAASFSSAAGAATECFRSHGVLSLCLAASRDLFLCIFRVVLKRRRALLGEV